MFDYMSSPMRWCEDKFVYGTFIAEFWNSVTSLFFCLIAFYGYYRQKDFINYKIWILFSSIGLASFWFHLTLSFIGQFCDEFTIILLLCYGVKRHFKINNYIYSFMIIIFGLISWFYSYLSPIILLSIGTTLIAFTYPRNQEEELKYLWKYAFRLGIVAISTWIFDFICIFNTHMWWHIFVCLSAYCFIIFVARPESENYKLVRCCIPFWKYNPDPCEIKDE